MHEDAKVVVTSPKSGSKNDLKNAKSGGSIPRMLWRKKRQGVAAQASVATQVPFVPKPERTKRLIEKAIQGNLLFGNLPGGALEVIINSMVAMEVPARHQIIKQGDQRANEFYVLEEGGCEVFVSKPGGGQPKLVTTYGPGSCFGELALLFDAPRAASVTTIKPCRLWVMKRSVYMAVQRNFMQDVFAARHKLMDEVPMLAKLSANQRAVLVDALHEVEFKAGQPVLKKGADVTHFYLIARGAANVMDPDGKVQSTLGAGDYFGERSLMDEERQAADIIAETRLLCYTLSRSEFITLLGSQRDIWVYETLRQVPILYNLTNSQLWELAQVLQPKSFSANECIFKAGEKGETFYIVEEGSFRIVDGKGKEVAEVGRGGCFGEKALLNDDKRAATVEAMTASRALVLHREQFVKLLGDLVDLQHLWRLETLRRIPLMSRLRRGAQLNMATQMRQEMIAAGTDVVVQGEEGTKFYIVEHGRLGVFIDGKGPNTIYSSGSYFGELALLHAEPRAATVRALTDATLLSLDRGAFLLLLGSLRAEFEKEAEAYLASGRIEAIDPKRVRTLATLGFGGFGKVLLVDYTGGMRYVGPLERSNTANSSSNGSRMPSHTANPFYALKCMNKSYIVEQGLVDHVKREKEIMSRLNSPWLVGMVATGHDATTIYVMMEAVLGGELFSYLQTRCRPLDENHARFYVASVISALQYMHDRGFVYRDLKPENLLIDTQGYVKVTDFGFAKYLAPGEKTYTLCGTPEYLAPEVIMNRGHNAAADWWAVGVLLFELVSGLPPFYDEDRMAMFRKTCARDFRFPRQFSESLRDLINRLLEPNPLFRLGAGPAGAAEIRRHPWFNGFSWLDFEQRKMTAPYMPKQPMHGGDACNFAGVNPETEHKAFRQKPYVSQGRFKDF